MEKLVDLMRLPRPKFGFIVTFTAEHLYYALKDQYGEAINNEDTLRRLIKNYALRWAEVPEEKWEIVHGTINFKFNTDMVHIKLVSNERINEYFFDMGEGAEYIQQNSILRKKKEIKQTIDEYFSKKILGCTLGVR